MVKGLTMASVSFTLFLLEICWMPFLRADLTLRFCFTSDLLHGWLLRIFFFWVSNYYLKASFSFIQLFRGCTGGLVVRGHKCKISLIVKLYHQFDVQSKCYTILQKFMCCFFLGLYLVVECWSHWKNLTVESWRHKLGSSIVMNRKIKWSATKFSFEGRYM